MKKVIDFSEFKKLRIQQERKIMQDPTREEIDAGIEEFLKFEKIDRRRACLIANSLIAHLYEYAYPDGDGVA